MFTSRPHGSNAPGASRVGAVPSLSLQSTRPFAGRFPHVHCQLRYLGVSENKGYLILGPYNKDPTI